MKTYILTESQLKRVINHVVNEQSTVRCEKSKLIDILTQNNFSTIYGKKILFKITGITYQAKLNGRYYTNDNLKKKPAYLTGDTLIELCNNESITFSGMGFPECLLAVNPNGGFLLQAQYA